MKFIKSRQKFLNEAKIRDVIFPRQAKEVASAWAERFLDYEEIEATPNIKQGKWKLEDADKNKVLGAFFQCDMDNVFNIFKNLPDKLALVLNQSVDLSLLKENQAVIMTNFDIKSPTIDQMVLLFDSVFRKLNINETRAAEMIQKDENGRPLKDEEGNMLKVAKEVGDPVFTKSLVNIKSFLGDYNRCYEGDDRVSDTVFDGRDLSSLRNLASDHVNDYKSDFEIFNKDMYLSISHNPKDILNMSISKFYSSCQHLYSGGYRSRVLGNVFDPNSIPAFLIFETPLFWKDEKISDFLPLSRMIVRNIETFEETNDSPKIFFDRAYPDRMKDVFGEIIEKYSQNIETVKNPGTYIWTPDIDMDDRVTEPYMDRLRLEKRPYIGVNTKTLYLNKSYDWSGIKIAPNAKIKELIIETTDIPSNLLEVNIELEWIKFKYIKINTLNGFENIKTDSIAFDKCKFGNNVLEDISKSNVVKKLQLVSCDVDDLSFNQFSELEELHLIYSLDSPQDLEKSIEGLNLNKLVISGDLVTKESKSFINSLKRRMKVEIIGPVI